MKIKDLQFGQYFQYETLVGRYVPIHTTPKPPSVYYLNGKIIILADDDVEKDVTPLTFHEALLQLAQQYTKNNQYVEIPPQNVTINDLPVGSFFQQNNKDRFIGRRYGSVVIYLIPSMHCWDYLTASTLLEITPLSPEQAVLLAIKKLLKPNIPTIPIPITYLAGKWTLKKLLKPNIPTIPIPITYLAGKWTLGWEKNIENPWFNEALEGIYK
jgi:hypothetical protein